MTEYNYPQEYDDLTSTPAEQKEFEEGCFERIDAITKSGLMDEIIEGDD